MELEVNMKATVKKRYQELKIQNYNSLIKREWQSNALLQECLETLGNNKKILSIEEQRQILDKFNIELPRLIKNRKKTVQSIQELSPQWMNRLVYIIWDEEKLPIIQINFESVLDHIDDIVAVAFDTCIVAENMNQFIQFDDRNRITEFNLERE